MGTDWDYCETHRRRTGHSVVQALPLRHVITIRVLELRRCHDSPQLREGSRRAGFVRALVIGLSMPSAAVIDRISRSGGAANSAKTQWPSAPEPVVNALMTTTSAAVPEPVCRRSRKPNTASQILSPKVRRPSWAAAHSYHEHRRLDPTTPPRFFQGPPGTPVTLVQGPPRNVRAGRRSTGWLEDSREHLRAGSGVQDLLCSQTECRAAHSRGGAGWTSACHS